MLIVVAKGFLKLPNLLMLIKQKSLSKLGPSDFWQIANSVLNRGKPTIPPLFNGHELLFFDSVKVKLFPKNLSENFNLVASGMSLPASPSRTNLKLYNISLTPMVIEKVINNLDSSKASGSGGILGVVLLKCESERSYILAELFSKCLREPCFPGYWKISSVVPVI